uniref:SERPIN domain-containing protein n=1 Tax=Brugia timori TaxID=42155 RepID=A0A0R3QUM8_9BILA
LHLAISIFLTPLKLKDSSVGTVKHGVPNKRTFEVHANMSNRTFTLALIVAEVNGISVTVLFRRT